jgi:hypothetical protein
MTAIWQVVTENTWRNIGMILIATAIATLIWYIDVPTVRIVKNKKTWDIIIKFVISFIAAYFATWILIDSGGDPSVPAGFITIAGAATGGLLYIKSIFKYVEVKRSATKPDKGSGNPA